MPVGRRKRSIKWRKTLSEKEAEAVQNKDTSIYFDDHDFRYIWPELFPSVTLNPKEIPESTPE